MEKLSEMCPCESCPSGCMGDCIFGCEAYADWVYAMRKKLAAYENAEEQGLLVRLPCAAEER